MKLPGVYASANMVAIAGADGTSGMQYHALGSTWKNHAIDAVALPMLNGDFFVTRGSLLAQYYSELVEKQQVFYTAQTAAPCIPVLVLSKDLDSLEPDREKALQFRAWDVLPTAVLGEGGDPWRYRQTFCDTMEVFVASPAVFSHIGSGHCVHWFSPNHCGYVFTFSPGERVRVRSLLVPGSRVVGAHPSGSPCTAHGGEWSVSDHRGRCVAKGRLNFSVTNVFFKLDGGVLAQCGRKKLCIGGNIVCRELSRCASDGVHVVGIGQHSVVALREEPSADIAVVARAGVTAVDVGSGNIVYAVWSGTEASLEFCSVSHLHWLPIGDTPPRKKKRSSPMEDVVRRVRVGQRRMWAVRVVRDAVLCGGNDWRVRCVHLESRNVLWSVDVGNVVLCLSLPVSGGTAVATADSMSWLSFRDRSIVAIPHSSIQTQGLQLCEGRFLEKSEHGGGLSCSLCDQTYPKGHEGGYCMNASQINFDVRELPRLLGIYSGSVQPVVRGDQIFSGDLCVCGSGKQYENCCHKLHLQRPYVSVDCGKDDHAYLMSLSSGPYFAQYLADWVFLGANQAIFERFPGWDGQQFDPTAGASIVTSRYGLGKVNDSQFPATADQYGLLRTKQPTNVQQGVVILRNDVKGCLVPGGIMFHLKSDAKVGTMDTLRVEYGVDFSK
ncbi:MAG: hypothetical protein CL454_00005 [Acidimicrobiaceae bacterium]|nr:hypothetical protein [Acidimicrobiaceae bacterium]